VKQNDASIRLLCLLKRKGDEPVQIAEIRRDQDHGRLSPSVLYGIRHGAHPIREELGTENMGRMCQGAPDGVSQITQSHSQDHIPWSRAVSGRSGSDRREGEHNFIRRKPLQARYLVKGFSNFLYCFFICKQTIVGNGIPTSYIPSI
jgi:hypothetical protein